MSASFTPENPLRVAIFGSGPAGFFTAAHLLGHKGLPIQVDLFDRLPTPYGLVRSGVAPDHENIKAVTASFDKTAAHPGFRFFGNVELGRDILVEELRRHYHQIVYATGSDTDRRMGIPGEDLAGSHSATAFVGWYNGHPDYRDHRFDLSAEQVVVVGVGNVAVDVCRILCRTIDELRTTDIADHALEALASSKVREVYMIGRRGPAQAAFTNPELRELGELADADIAALPGEAALDETSERALKAAPDRSTQKKVEMVAAYAARPRAGRRRLLMLRFMLSPEEVLGDANGRVAGVRFVKNVFRAGPDGAQELCATSERETLPCGLLFRSIGYKGVPLPGVPFDAKRAVVSNERGRVLDPDTRQPRTGEYAAGWIKRGPTGVIGTNKPDARETVDRMMEDLAAGRVLAPEAPQPGAVDALLCARGCRFMNYAEWLRINELEVARGREQGRPRVKFTRVDEMLRALGRA